MAYTTHPGNQRFVAVGTVAVVHAALGLALVYGLAGGVATIVKDERLTSFFVPPKETPPPPQPKVEPKADETVTTTPEVAPEQNLTFTINRTVAPSDILPPIPGPVAPNPADFIKVEPAPSPSPAFTPKGPKPINQSRWISTSDYPTASLNRGDEGLVQYRVTVGTNGKVKSCEVLATSGFERLDKGTCSKVSSRARFEPATNSAGEKVMQTYTGSVQWTIPNK